MEVVEADIFNLFIVVVEVAERMNFVVVAFGGDVPKRQSAVVASCNNLSMFIGVPLQTVAFMIMAGKDNFGVDFDSASFEHNFVKDMDFPFRSPSGDQISFLGVVSDFIDLSVVLDLMLDNDHLFNGLVVFLDGLVGFDGFYIARYVLYLYNFFMYCWLGRYTLAIFR